MKLKFKLDERKVYGTVYDKEANVSYEGLRMTPRKIVDAMSKIQEESPELVNIIHGMYDFKTKEAKTVYRIANDIEEENMGEGGIHYYRTWNNLWEFFGVKEYKDACFSEKGLYLDEVAFINKLFREGFELYKNENVTEKRKKKILEAERNLYQIIERRIPITNDIKKKFYDINIKYGLNEIDDSFDKIDGYINKLNKLFYEDENCLTIKEKVLWAKGVLCDLKYVFNKWNRIYENMILLKNSDMDEEENLNKYHGLNNPECLLMDAMKEVANSEMV